MVLSGQNLALGVVFIVLGGKAEYATYVLLFGAQLLLASVQYATLLTPFTATASRLTGVERSRYMDSVFIAQAVLGAALAAAAAVGVALWKQSVVGPPLLAAAFACAILGANLREFRRTEQVIEGRLTGLVAADIVSAFIAFAGIGCCVLARVPVTATVVLFFSGCGGILTGLRRLRSYDGLPDLMARFRPAVRGILEAARWTLPWTLLSWVQNNSYPYLVAGFAGHLAVADAAAARLVLGPVAVVTAGWARLFLSRASSLIARGEGGSALRSAKRAAMWMAIGICFYVPLSIAVLGVGLIPQIPKGYSGVGALVVIWGGCFLASSLRGVASTTLLALCANRTIFLKTLIALSVSLPLMSILGAYFGVRGVLIGVAAGEGILALLLWKALHHWQQGIDEATVVSATLSGPKA